MANGKTNVTNNFGEQSTQYQKPIGTDGPFQLLPGGCGLYAGAGAPDFVCTAGSIYYRNDGASGNEVVYVNHDGLALSWAPLAVVV